MSAKFTPGPWLMSVDGEVCNITTPAGIYIVDAIPNFHNARLIAKSPAMYATVQELLACLEGSYFGPATQQRVDAAKRLLATIDGDRS